ncbi:hypothetical protein [Geothrix sp. 21YS21S-2]|uniref:hypothetical protein n=1 Tax=Geothrix sp. 21YS21S-2 TaxID=3068893 RepID=UPI0027BA1F40|nr:hypothetical protein [Geothrix sp. 21YS21S-2]
MSLAAAGLLALAAAALPPVTPTWHEARSAHFRFFTNGGEKDGAERVRAFEALYGILRNTTPDLRVRRPQAGLQLPCFVYLFGSVEGFRSFSRTPDEAGFFVQHPDGGYIALNSDSSQGTETAYHEYLHQYLAFNHPGVPLWLNEGLACFFQTLRLEGQEVVLGTPPAGYLPALAAGGCFPAARLLALDPASPEYARGPERQRVYATVWLLTSYLVTTGEERRAKLGAFLDLIGAGRSAQESFERAFQCAPQALDRELADYLALLARTRQIHTWTLQFRHLQVDAAFTWNELTPSETLARLGLLRLAPGHGSLESAADLFQAALEADPRCATARFGLGLLAALDPGRGDAAGNFRQASLAEPDNAVYHYFAGMALGGGDEARTHLRRSLQLGCPFPDTLLALARLVMAGGAPQEGELALLEDACRARPGQYGMKYSLATIYAQASHPEQARALLREVAAQTLEPHLARAAQLELEVQVRKEVERLAALGMEAFRGKRYGEAVARMEEALRAAPPAMVKDLQENLDRMRILIDLRSRPRPPVPGRKG